MGLYFVFDFVIFSWVNVGGMIGNNFFGIKSIVFGKMVDYVIELKVLLEDGMFLYI